MFKQEELDKMFKNKLESEEMVKYIEAKIEASIKNSIDEQFRFYSNDASIHKNIAQTINEIVGINLSKMNIPEFQQSFLNLIQDSINKSANEKIGKAIEDSMQKLLFNRKEITAEDIVFAYLEDFDLTEEYREAFVEDDYSCDQDSLEKKEVTIEDAFEFESIGFDLLKDENLLVLCIGKKKHDWWGRYENYLHFKRVKESNNKWKCYHYHIGGIEQMNVITNEFMEHTRLLFSLANENSFLVLDENDFNNLEEVEK